MILALTFLILAIGCYSISQLRQHGKLRWMKNDFWDVEWRNKYKWSASSKDPLGYDVIPFPEPAPDNWYYRFFKIKYKERFLFSATFLVSLTDWYHFAQFWMFNFLSLSVTFALGFNWWLLLGVWSLIHLTHFILYKLLSKQP